MNYDVCVIGGAGHVGLPLAIAFADRGKNVLIYDVNEAALAIINQGNLPSLENGAEEPLRRTIGKTLFTSSDPQNIRFSRYVVVVIGTPVDEHLNPRFHDMKVFFNSLLPHLHSGQTVILRSTVYPGITQKVNDMLTEAHPGIRVSFCPERIAEGKAMEELYSLPQIISGFSEAAVEEVGQLFRLLTDEILIVTPLEAELAKLFTNSWRYIQFATANQFYMLAEEYGVDFYRIYDAMTQNYPRTKGFPRPGFAAGPCLFKDTMQISAFSNNKFFLGHSAMLVNEGLPNFLVERVKRTHKLSQLTAGILGMAFKSEIDDRRESLSYKLKKLLQVEAKDVLCSDVYIKSDYFVDEADLIERSDVIFIGAPHRRYKTLDYRGRTVIDVWNLLGQSGLAHSFETAQRDVR